VEENVLVRIAINFDLEIELKIFKILFKHQNKKIFMTVIVFLEHFIMKLWIFDIIIPHVINIVKENA